METLIAQYSPVSYNSSEAFWLGSLDITACFQFKEKATKHSRQKMVITHSGSYLSSKDYKDKIPPAIFFF